MHINITLGIIVALALPLQGCGKKGPLKFPAPQTQNNSSQTPVTPVTEQSKQP